MKNAIILFLCLLTSSIYGQVTSVDYLMKYNCDTDQYDVSLVILAGSATTIPQRAQFNSQVSLVVPTGETVMITDLYMPIQNNQQYDGTVPMTWSLGSPVLSPAAQPESDFYGVTPVLSPASFYNDLHTGDIVPLFSFLAGESGEYDERIRFYNNGSDPVDTDPGMNGGNFSNGFTIGGATQVYNGNQVESCITNIDEPLALEWKAYPSPFQETLNVEIIEETSRFQIIGNGGKVYYDNQNIKGNLLVINALDFPSGLYIIQVDTPRGIAMKKVVKY